MRGDVTPAVLPGGAQKYPEPHRIELNTGKKCKKKMQKALPSPTAELLQGVPALGGFHLAAPMRDVHSPGSPRSQTCPQCVVPAAKWPQKILPAGTSEGSATSPPGQGTQGAPRGEASPPCPHTCPHAPCSAPLHPPAPKLCGFLEPKPSCSKKHLGKVQKARAGRGPGLNPSGLFLWAFPRLCWGRGGALESPHHLWPRLWPHPGAGELSSGGLAALSHSSLQMQCREEKAAGKGSSFPPAPSHAARGRWI